MSFPAGLDALTFLPVLVALALSTVLTPVVIASARRVGMVAQPKPDRWHRKPTAMLGGMAVMLATLGGFAFAQPSALMWFVFGMSGAMCALGLVDDIFHIKPYQKLVVQILGAVVVIGAGLNLPWTSSVTVNMIITMFWIIGITNALNLLDNMDGLAAGIAVIASAFLAVNFLSNGQPAEATFLLVFAAALLGFLVYNFDPASVFMGDCGSMFIGFFLATSALMTTTGTGGRTRSLVPVLAVPILIFAIPIFDTTFVTVMRKLSGRAASQGGRDHTSHRLVGLGMSERSAVLMLYAFAVLAGMVALAARHMQMDVSLAITATFVIALTIGGVHLAGVRVYSDEMSALRAAPLYAFLVDLSYKRRIFEVLLDSVLVVLAYYLSYLTLFGPYSNGQPDWQIFVETVPYVVGAMMISMLAMGVYRGVWRYTSVDDLNTLVRGAISGSLVSLVLVGFVFRFVGFSRAVFALNALFLVAGTAAGRLSFRMLKRRHPQPRPVSQRRVVIFGAGDAGERILRELVSNPFLNYTPVAFLDDDRRKAGRVIHGLRVYAAGVSPAAVCRTLGAEEIVVSSQAFSSIRMNEIWSDCAPLSIAVSRVQISFERVTGFTTALVSTTEQHYSAHGSSRRISAEQSKRLVVENDTRRTH